MAPNYYSKISVRSMIASNLLLGHLNVIKNSAKRVNRTKRERWKEPIICIRQNIDFTVLLTKNYLIY